MRSEGAVLLSRVQATDEEIAARTGVNRTVVTRWKLGERVPGDSYRRLLRAEFEIAVEAWDRDADAPPAAPVTVADPFDLQVQRMRVTVQRLIDRADFYAAKNDDKMASRCVRDGVAALRELGRMTGETLEITSERAAKLPVVRNLVTRLLEAAKDHPEALRAMRSVLEGEPS